MVDATFLKTIKSLYLCNGLTDIQGAWCGDIYSPLDLIDQ